MVSADQFFGNRGTLSITSGDSTIAVIKGIEINDKYEHTKLFGFGSINRQGAARHNHEVEVKIKYAQFDATCTTFMGARIAGAGGLPATATPQLFTVIATAVGDTTTNKLCATVASVYFENFPMNLAENDYMVTDLTGYGVSVVYTNP